MMQPTGPEQTAWSAPGNSRPSRTRWLIAAVVTGIVVAVSVVTVVVVVAVRSADTSRGVTYRMDTPAQAGGLQLQAPGARTVGPSWVEFDNVQRVLRNRAKTIAYALYDDPDHNVFRLDVVSGDLGDPADLLARLRANPPAANANNAPLSPDPEHLRTWKSLAATDPGPHGGNAACGEAAPPPSLAGILRGDLVCFWQTEHTFGSLDFSLDLVLVSSHITLDRLSAIMRAVRADVEKRT